MEENNSTLEKLLIEIANAFNNLGEALADLDTIVLLMEELGWDIEGVLSAGAENTFRSKFQVLNVLPNLVIKTDEVATASTSEDKLVALLELGSLIADVAAGIKTFAEEPWNDLPAPFNSQEFRDDLANLPLRLSDYLITTHVGAANFPLYSILRLLSVFREEYFIPPAGASSFRIEHDYVRIDWSLFSTLLNNPKQLAEQMYGWNTQEGDVDYPFDAPRLIESLADVFNAFGLAADVIDIEKKLSSVFYEGESEDNPHPPQLNLPIFQGQNPITKSGYLEAGFNICPVPPKTLANNGNGIADGLLIYPYASHETEPVIQLSEHTQLTIEAEADTGASIGIETLPDGVNLVLPGEVGSPSGSINIAIQNTPETPFTVFSIPSGTGLYIGSVGVGIQGKLVDENFEVVLKALFEKGVISIQGGEGDGFLKKILPEEGIQANFDVTALWSSQTGFHLEGSGALEVTLPVHTRLLDVINIDSIYLFAGAVSDGVSVKVGITGDVELGPVLATVKQIGVRGYLLFPQSGGNLGGNANIDLGFLPPTGAGLALNSSGISGGGFLEFDDLNKRYAGILALKFDDIALTAIGLISTRLPDGSDGFSLLVNIGVRFSPPIQLSFGFTLSGVGGLIGVNRTMRIEPLRTGLKNHTLDSILFPDPSTMIVNANRIISDLRAVFPPEEGHYIIAPMVVIGWGSPNIITAELGVFLELPGLNQIVVLGQIGATFPNEDNVVVELHLDVLGVLDVQRKKFFINASLYDSSILSFQLRGDAGLLWSWSNRPNFALTLGGFHPDFKQVPQELTTIQERLSLIIRDTKNLKIKGEVYKALTSNTLQFGARIDLYAKKGRGSIDGYLGFDGLIIFSPFGFIVAIEGGVSARAFGRKLASVKLRLELQGPTPWVADGYASFSVCWKSIKVGFHKTWGQDSTPSIPAVDPLVPLLAAMSNPSSWGAILPDGMFLAEALRTPDEDNTETDSEQQGIVIVHPAGAIEIRPNVLPFNIELQRFGNAPVKSHNRFAIKVSDLLNSEYGLDYFARNQFESLNEDEKLSKPSFEALEGVVTIRSNTIDYGNTLKSCPLYYETILLDDNNSSTRPDNNGKFFGVDWLFATRLVAGNAANVGSWRMSGKYRYQIANPTSKVAISEEGFHVVSMSDQNITQLGNSLANNDGTLTYWAAEQALNTYTTQNSQQQGQLQLVAQYELAANQKLAPVVPLPVADTPEEIDEGTPIAYYHFLPWLRIGLSTLIKQQATGIRAKFNIEAEIVADQLGSNSQEIESIPVQTIHLYGPGDIQAIDERMIVRTDPKPYTSDAEPNYFPMIEFADPDFAWRIPSNKIDSDLPWLTLIVLNEDEFTAFQAGEDKTNCITVNTSSLPNLDWSKRWAHVQVTSAGDEQDPDDLTQEELGHYLKNKPQQVISRLLCARRLNPSTKYHAFVLPTFKLAHVPYIGLPNENDNAATPAWDSGQSSETNLVYYYRWEFMTGLRGDFEHLVRLLEKRKLSNLGITTIDCSNSGYDLNFNEGRDADLPQSLGMEGALMSLDTEFSNWGNDKKDDNNQPTPEVTNFQRSLADNVLNKPAENLLLSDSDPIIAPPIYGQWQAQRNRVDPDSNHWLDHLNLDPRHRAVAGLGTKVIQKQQESLMASAWEQVGDIDEANERLRRAQLGRVASVSLFGRMQAQATGDFLRLTASMFAKVKPVSANSDQSTTIYSKFENSRIPMAAVEPAFQRIQRTYQKRRVIENSSSGDILERLNIGEIAAAGSLPRMGGMPSICDISVEMLNRTGVTKLIENACGKGEEMGDRDRWKKRLELFCYEELSCDELTQEIARITKDYGEKLDTRAREALNLLLEYTCEDINERTRDEDAPASIDLEDVRNTLIIALNPNKTVPERTLANIDFGGIRVPADPCSERQVIVKFPQPMYESLRDISQDYILPGIENIAKNTVGLLKTNRRFIESYLLGCNHELSSEALWRELPVPLRDSFFRQFWDVKDYMPTESDIGEVGLEVNHPDFSEKMDMFLERKLKDISHIVDWGESRLGENNNPFYQANNSDQQERTILIIRGDLLKKYPNPVIYAVPAFFITNDEDSTVPALPEFKYRVSELQGDEFDSEIKRRIDPVISGFLPADIKFFGFEIDPEDSRYWYIVIEERVSESRFGMDTFNQGDVPPELNSRNDLSWGHIPLLSEECYINGEEPKDLENNSLSEWGENSSIIACDTLQKPARVVIKAKTMIPG